MQRKRTVPAKRGYHTRQASGRSKAIGVALIVAALALLWFLLDTIIALGVGESRFYNVYVNGVPLKGYTKQQGYQWFEKLEADWQSRSFELYHGNDAWSFSPAMVGAQLNEEEAIERAWNFGHVGNIFARKSQIRSLAGEPQYFTSAISYDEALMEDFLRSVQQKTDKPAVDAVVALGDDGPWVKDKSSDGSKLDVDATLKILNNLMLTGAAGERMELPVEILKPAITTEDASESLNVIAEFTTGIVGSRESRKWNIKKALSSFNGVTVYPGMQMGFNEIVGERTQAHGFKKAPEFSEGTTTEDYGGGVCQASTTLYGALLQSGMTIVRRSPHSMTVGYVYPSLDAAVTNTGSKDLVFRNDSDHPMYIYTNVTEASATVKIYGARPPYHYDYDYKVLMDNIPGTREVLRVDTTGEYATYTDEKVLGSEAKMGRKSEGWLISYDWETGEEVKREKLSTDYYEPGVTVYYTGTQVRSGPSATPTPW
ncbi:MAG: Vancomycin B-type resistance protein VanW [Firmicutes bacterium ADurb.Bin467]|nr:MAG: Vancomycin B-type resistance protein VanW [Firmicutes bacterium ADurb.Bin467]